MKHASLLRIVTAGTIAIVGALALAGCGNDNSASTASQTSKASSKSVNVVLANHVWTNAIKKRIPDFEKKTGIKVNLTQLSEDQLADNYNVKLNAGSGDFDVMMYRPLQVGKLFARNGYFADLSQRVKQDPKWNWSDFQSGPKSLVTYKGKTVGVPIVTESEVLYYRKDLLKKAGLEVPKTMQELRAAAKTISEQNKGVAGFVSRTQASAAVTQFSGFLYSFGGDWTDGHDKATINSDAAKKAYAFYGSLLHDYGPAQVTTDMSWPQAMAIFQQGKAAFETEASSLFDNLTNPKKSKVASDVGVAPFPAGPAGSRPYNVAAWALGINANSKNQDNAWKFIKWATSPAMVLALQQEGNPGARTSVWDNPKSTQSLPADLVKAIAANAKNGVGKDRPLVINVSKAREIVGKPIAIAITGGDSAAAADTANKAFQSLLDSEK